MCNFTQFVVVLRYVMRKYFHHDNLSHDHYMFSSNHYHFLDDVPLEITFPGLNDTRFAVEETSPLFVTCLVIGIPTPSAIWKKKGKVIQSCNYLEKQCNLTIPSMQFPDDNGAYTCEIFNNFERISKGIYVEVQGIVYSVITIL